MTLTPAGFAWAKANAPTSIVARIALYGHEQGWPTTHTDAAIAECNNAAAATPARA